MLGDGLSLGSPEQNERGSDSAESIGRRRKCQDMPGIGASAQPFGKRIAEYGFAGRRILSSSVDDEDGLRALHPRAFESLRKQSASGLAPGPV